MTQQDIWDLWAAIDELKTKRKEQDEKIDKLTKSLRRLRADSKRARAKEREICDKAEQTVREEAATLIQVLGDCFEKRLHGLELQDTKQGARADTRDQFEDEVRQLLGLGPREKMPWDG